MNTFFFSKNVCIPKVQFFFQFMCLCPYVVSDANFYPTIDSGQKPTLTTPQDLLFNTITILWKMGPLDENSHSFYTAVDNIQT